MALACFLVTAVCLLLFLHPFVTYPVSLSLANRWLKRERQLRAPARADVSVSTLKFSVCMCAYNEEKVIKAKAANLAEIIRQYPGSEVLIYIDGNTDRTSELLDPYRQMFTIVCGEGRRGKTHGMKILVGMAKNDLVLFTDANIDVDVPSLSNLARYFSDPTIGCIGTCLLYRNIHSATSKSNASYRNLEEKLHQLESGLGSALVADGALFAIRRQLYVPPADDLIDDLYVSLSIVCNGYRLVHAEDVRASEDSISVQKEEFRRKIRIACQSMNIHRLLWPQLRRLSWRIRYQYVSHKLLRWVGIVPLGMGYVFAVAGSFGLGGWLAALICASLPFAGWAMAAAMPKSIFAKFWNIFMAILATGIGVLKSLRGERFQTWEPAKSIRSGG